MSITCFWRGACRTLNRIQSRIYHTAFNSNENLLVCAPTGAGKTNIAMVAVLRELASNMRAGVIQKADFKIVYVAPMKALAAEVTATFSRRLAALGAPACSDGPRSACINTIRLGVVALPGVAIACCGPVAASVMDVSTGANLA